MFAVIQTGGKQYKVSQGQIIHVNKVEGSPGDKIAVDVLAIGGDAGLKMGADAKGAGVTAEIVEQFRDDKVIVFKKKRRQNYRRKNGHRQYLTSLRIGGLGDAAPKAAKKAKTKE